MARTRKRRRSFGAIRLLPSGRYQASFQDKFSNRFIAPHTFTTYEQADYFLAQKKVDIEKGLFIDPRKGKITLREWWLEYSNSRQDWAATTRQLNEHTAEAYVLAKYSDICLADIPIQNITAYAVRKWWANVQKAALQKSASIFKSTQPSFNKAGTHAASKAYKLLKQLFNEAVKCELLFKNPVNINGADKAESPSRPAFTHEQVAAIAEKAPKRYKALIRVAAYSGLREGELCALERRDYNPETKQIKVNKAKIEIGSKTQITSPKTKASYRDVVLPPKVAAELEQHLKTFYSDNPTALIFTTEIGSIITRGTLYRWFKPILESLGLSEYHFHDLRRTNQRAAKEAGANTKEVMARQGHADFRASIIYDDKDPEADKKIAEAIDQNIIELDLYRSA